MKTDTAFVPRQHPVHYQTVSLSELDVFYREAGPKDAPAILLLHGFPTSSNMFRNLIPRLAESFHVVAPDYPGFGNSSAPDHKSFAYTFENLTNIVEQLVEKLGLKSYSLYVFDYGAAGPKHPEWGYGYEAALINYAFLAHASLKARIAELESQVAKP
jgi:pimeloyl-ACP methyl ester carboxylesterase